MYEKKKVMSKLAALTLAAAMTATAIPAIAAPVFADVDVSTNGNVTISDDPVTVSTATPVSAETTTASTNLTNAVMDAVNEKLQTAGETDSQLSGSVTLTLGTVTASTVDTDGNIQKGTIASRISDSTHTVYFDLQINTYTEEEKVNLAKALIEANAKKNYKKNETLTENAAATNAKTVLTSKGLTVGDEDSEELRIVKTVVSNVKEATATTAGSATVTIDLAAGKDNSATGGENTLKTATATFDVTTESTGLTIPTDAAAATTLIESALSDRAFYDDEITNDSVADAITSYLTDAGYAGINTTVILNKNSYTTENTHDALRQTATATVSITQGDAQAVATVDNVNVVHSPKETIAETKAIFEKLVKEENKQLAKGKAETDEDSVKAEVQTLISNALNTQPTYVENGATNEYNTALSADYSGLANVQRGGTITLTDFSYTAPTKTTAGKATVTVTMKVGNDLRTFDPTDGSADKLANRYVTDTYEFTLDYPATKEVNATKIELGNAKTVECKSSDLPLNTIDLYDMATIEPEGANDITWSSDNDDIVVDENGVVTAKKFGTATITAKSANGITDTVKVTFKALDSLFEDVTDATQYYYSPVYKLRDMSVVTGKTDTKFDPFGTTTRGEMITMLYRYFLYENGTNGTPASDTSYSFSENFTDVNDGDYFQKAVAWAQTYGITAGTGSTFKPYDKITRGQMVTFLYRYAQKFGGDTSVDEQGKNAFSDVKTTDYYAVPCNWAAKNNIATGYTDGTYRPNNNCTRADAATLLYRAISKGFI